ncbi:DUF488 domain-containing protein [Streptomyces buecherae]|uniref:DUF488 family protein n=1 Tax=Streptomyces buecherae TaxID=2763006 RepID=A0A7H8NFH2_9ACTN|nr:DUF488 family protein [Streptomyces buecherae]QKW53224.1 DUF488 family protein [Streptomyces buecherae]
MARAAKVRVRRVYEEPTADDGARVLVDRIWPRGLTKDAARLDDWCKNAAPSTQLRRWYDHDPARRDEFARRYQAELAEPAAREALDQLHDRARHDTLTLLTATKDLDLSHATILAEAVRAGR